MAKCCSIFVLNCSAPASAGVPLGPCLKAFRFELKTRAHAPLSAAASGRNTSPLAGSLRKPLRRLRMPRSMPIIWRPSMPPCAGGVRPIAEKPLPTPKRKNGSSNALMSTGSSITLSGSISPPSTSLPWPWVSWSRAYPWQKSSPSHAFGIKRNQCRLRYPSQKWRICRQAGIALSLLAHISPIEWSNVILYGEYKLNRDLVRR
jgi:hypothetical protein